MELDAETRYTHYLRLGSLVRGGSIEPHWLPDGDSFWYAEPTDEGLAIFVVDAEGNRRALFDVPRLRTVIEQHLGRPLTEAGVLFAEFTLSDDGKRATFELDGHHLSLDLDTYQVSEPAFGFTPNERTKDQPRLVRRPLQTGEPDVWEALSPDG